MLVDIVCMVVEGIVNVMKVDLVVCGGDMVKVM